MASIVSCIMWSWRTARTWLIFHKAIHVTITTYSQPEIHYVTDWIWYSKIVRTKIDTYTNCKHKLTWTTKSNRNIFWFNRGRCNFCAIFQMRTLHLRPTALHKHKCRIWNVELLVRRQCKENMHIWKEIEL